MTCPRSRECLTQSCSLQADLDAILKDYVGRATPLYYAERLSEYYKRCAKVSGGFSQSLPFLWMAFFYVDNNSSLPEA